MSRLTVIGNENVKIVLGAYLRRKWIDLCQTKNQNGHNRLLIDYVAASLLHVWSLTEGN